jgi:alcohol dehydrogenase class IV
LLLVDHVMSPIDFAYQALANSAFTLEDLAKLHIGADPKPDPKSLQPCTLPIFNIPTSLSGGEYTPRGGATDFRTHQKASFQHPSIGASLVILDPAITVSTPERVWLGSGIRAVDHCVEGLCSIFFDGSADPDAKTNAEKAFIDGLRLLLPNLLLTKDNPEDLSARRKCMQGVVKAVKGLKAGVPMGASHGIGHQLGPLGVSHGETSCVLLPSVLRYNRRHGGTSVYERQRRVVDILEDLGLDKLGQNSKNTGASELGDVMAAIVAGLGLPTTLKEVGVGNEKFKELADNSMKDRYIPTNPVPITHADQVLEILQMATTD